ncbi:proteasome assembly chaperone family protein [Candidatus Woesearchaeota archaeon]|nr:proteasome assembly chaperone family protein [Candidatus Woesearchaeota archaeon]
MKIHLHEKPQNVRLVLGFPGFGLVGTIATKFLIEHLDVKKIGEIESNKLLPLAAIHKNKLIGPLDLFYNKKFNIVIMQTLSELAGSEWHITEVIDELARTLNAKEIIILEGLPTNDAKDTKGSMKTYFYSSNNLKAGEKLGLPVLQEGVMMGVTATVMLRVEDVPISVILAESPSKFPDSEAAARTIQALDKYWNMDIDYKPLMKAAKSFEVMLKELMEKVKTQQAGAPAAAGRNPDLEYIG